MEQVVVHILASVLFIFLVNLGNVEPLLIQHYDCWKPRDAKPCTIHSVAIDPCPSSKAEKSLANPCEVERGNVTATLKFEYTPGFNSTSPQAQAFKTGLLQDLSLVGMNTNACNYTKCPLIAGVQNTYTYPMEIKTEYPEGPYTVKWKLWNEHDFIKEACCMKFKIILL